jgi:hypothetical protein
MIVRGNLARADAASTARANTSFTRTQFALIFWDILFAPVDGVFETPFQTAPLDLATDAFSIGASRGQVTSHSAGRTNPRRDGRLIGGRSAVRRPAINERLAAIAAGEGPALLKETDDRERPLETFAVGIRWDRYTQEDLLEIVEVRRRRLHSLLLFLPTLKKSLPSSRTVHWPASACCDLDCLCGRVRPPNWRYPGSLVRTFPNFILPPLLPLAKPVLTRPSFASDSLWNPETSRALFSEIKGPGDQLSETQKVWIDVLLAAGVGVEVVKVVETKERRDETPDAEDEDEEDAVDDGEDVKDEEGGGPKKKKKKNTTQTTKKRKRAAKTTPARGNSVVKEGSAAPPRRAARPAKKKQKIDPAVVESREGGPVQEMVLDDSD